MDDDCFAVRLAYAYRRRFGAHAGDRAATRLTRALVRADTVKSDLYIAVTVVLRDDDRIFSRSRALLHARSAAPSPRP